MKEHGKRLLSALLLLCALCFVLSVGLPVAEAAETKTYLYRLPLAGDGARQDSNWATKWGHGALTFKNGYSSGATNTSVPFIVTGSYSGNIAYCVEPGGPLNEGGSLSNSNTTAVSFWNTAASRNDLLEAAKLDGISDFGYLVKVVIPLSKPVISVILLYCVVGLWNAYFVPLIYLRDRNLFPLQLILQEILSATRIDATQIADSEVLAGIASQVDAMKYSLVVVATVPMLVIYPFVQKFFEKGVMIGSLKG